MLLSASNQGDYKQNYNNYFNMDQSTFNSKALPKRHHWESQQFHQHSKNQNFSPNIAVSQASTEQNPLQNDDSLSGKIECSADEGVPGSSDMQDKWHPDHTENSTFERKRFKGEYTIRPARLTTQTLNRLQGLSCPISSLKNLDQFSNSNRSNNPHSENVCYCEDSTANCRCPLSNSPSTKASPSLVPSSSPDREQISDLHLSRSNSEDFLSVAQTSDTNDTSDYFKTNGANSESEGCSEEDCERRRKNGPFLLTKVPKSDEIERVQQEKNRRKIKEERKELLKAQKQEPKDFITISKMIAAKFGGICKSTACKDITSPLKYQCQLNHNFESAEPLRSNGSKWCPKCDKIYDKWKTIASYQNGKLISNKYDAMLEFECQFGHQWKTKPVAKNSNDKWCGKCSKVEKEKQVKEEKDKMKMQYREESARIQEYLEQKQAELLEEARKAMSNEGKFSPSGFMPKFEGHCYSQSKVFCSYSSSDYSSNGSPNHYPYQQNSGIPLDSTLEEQMNEVARKMAHKFTSDPNFNKSCTFEESFIVYKILVSSEYNLLHQLLNAPKNIATSTYRKLALVLHPDKNKHPQANEAFQKLTDLFSRI